MPINLDPAIIRKSESLNHSKKSSYSELDRMKPSQPILEAVHKSVEPDPAHKAFTTDSAFRSRTAR